MESDGAGASMITEPTEFSKDPFEMLLENLALNNKVICKSQQKNEIDLSTSEKISILRDMLVQNKAKFLFRFGQFLNSEELKLFEQFQYNPDTGYEIAYHLQHIHRFNSAQGVKNRRYSAVKRLSKDEYFSEKEMRRRNPLLYDQLVGLYLSSKEVQVRDMQERNEKTLVEVLMDGIEKEDAEIKRVHQEEAEDDAMEEEDDDSSDSGNENDMVSFPPKPSSTKGDKVSRTFWGEIQSDAEPKRIKKPMTDAQISISAQGRKLLKEEFYNTMLESFIDGKDDFDYASIDNNEEYDNLEILDRDEEEKYFDSEDVEETVAQVDKEKDSGGDTSEDELETYMNALNQHPVVSHLADALKKL